MTRYLAIDYGTRRIGLAIGDDALRLASPVGLIDSHGRMDDDTRAVSERADEFGAEAFVIGLPLNMDDTEGPQAKVTRQFGEVLARETGLPVHYFDERLSTCEADEKLQAAELTRGKKKRIADAVAAQVILQTFLDSLPKTSP